MLKIKVLLLVITLGVLCSCGGLSSRLKVSSEDIDKIADKFGVTMEKTSNSDGSVDFSGANDKYAIKFSEGKEKGVYLDYAKSEYDSRKGKDEKRNSETVVKGYAAYRWFVGDTCYQVYASDNFYLEMSGPSEFTAELLDTFKDATNKLKEKW